MTAMLRPRSLTVLASAVIDVVLDVDKLPERGSDVVATPVTTEPGGAFNVASAAARLGVPTRYAGPFGIGLYSDQLLDALRNEHITVAGTRSADDVGYCVTLVEPEGERTFVSVVGCDASMSPDELAALTWDVDDAVYISGYDLSYNVSGPLLVATLPRLPSTAIVVVDPGPRIAQIPIERWEAIAPYISVLSWNEREAAMLPRLSAMAEAAVQIERRAKDGAVLRVPGEPPTTIEAYPVSPLDTNGAGDVHVGAMVAAMHDGLSWPEVVRFANKAAAYSTQRRGGGSGPTRRDLETFTKGC